MKISCEIWLKLVTYISNQVIQGGVINSVYRSSIVLNCCKMKEMLKKDVTVEIQSWWPEDFRTVVQKDNLLKWEAPFCQARILCRFNNLWKGNFFVKSKLLCVVFVDLETTCHDLKWKLAVARKAGRQMTCKLCIKMQSVKLELTKSSVRILVCNETLGTWFSASF